jgi:opacity protein-like surface antigen
MKRFLTAIVLCAAPVVLLPGELSAGDASLSPWYFTMRAGVTNFSQRDTEYVNPRVFATVSESNDDNFNFMGAAAIGYHLATLPVRLEIEYAHRSGADFTRDTLGFCPAPCGGFAPVNGLSFNGYNTIHFKNQTAMLNGYWDIPVAPKFTAFVGAGAGVSFNQTSASQVATANFTPPDAVLIPPGVLAPFAIWPQETTTSFAWSATAGMSANITRHFAIDFGYRFVGLGTYDTKLNPNLFNDEKFRATVYTQEAFIGGRYRF